MWDQLCDIVYSESFTGIVMMVIAGVFGLLRELELAKKAKLEKALSCVEAGVIQTYEAYVRGRKQASADGTLTEMERIEARNMALTSALGYAKAEGIDLLKYYGKELLPALIEKLVGVRKAASLPFPGPEQPDR